MISDFSHRGATQRWCHAIIVGVGAIGSHLVGHLARLEAMERITIIDSATYDAHHARYQHIASTHIGKWKAKVQKRWVEGIDGDLEVEGISEPLESLSLGLFRRASLIVSSIDADAHSSRIVLNEIAWRTGVVWLDSGVSPDGHAWIHAYFPGPDRPCYLCSLVGTGLPPPAAVQPFRCLGAIAGSHLAYECEKVLSAFPPQPPQGGAAFPPQPPQGGAAFPPRPPQGGGGVIDRSQAGRRLRIDPLHDRLTVSATPWRPDCGFDHQTWKIEPKPGAGQMTLKTLIDEGADSVWLDRHTFAAAFQCPVGHRREWVRLERRLPDRFRCRNPRCGLKYEVEKKSRIERLRIPVSESSLERPLSRLGFRDGDVISISCGSEIRHLELGGDRGGRAPAAPSASPGRSGSS